MSQNIVNWHDWRIMFANVDIRQVFQGVNQVICNNIINICIYVNIRLIRIIIYTNKIQILFV